MVLCPECGAPADGAAAFCSQCGEPLGRLPATTQRNVIEIGGRRYALASFRSRLGAFVIDLVLAWALALAIQMGLGAAWGSSPSPFEQSAAPGSLLLVTGLVLMALQWLEESAGVSPGKKMVGLRIVRGDGARPGPVHGFARMQMRVLSAAPVLLGYLWVIWDRESQAWHDKVANTRVVRSGPDFEFRPAAEFATREDPFARIPLAAGRGPWVWSALGVAILAFGFTFPLWLDDYEPPAQARQEFEPTHPVPARAELLAVEPAEPPADACPGEGRRVCLVPIGHEPTVSLEGVAEDLATSLNAPIAVLSPLPLPAEAEARTIVDWERGQLDGDGVLQLLEQTLPASWHDPDVTLIGVTWHDMYFGRAPQVRYVLGARSGWVLASVVSSARLGDAAWGEPADEALLAERLEKLLRQEIGLLHYGLAPEFVPESAMFCCANARAAVDRMSSQLELTYPDGPPLYTFRPLHELPSAEVMAASAPSDRSEVGCLGRGDRICLVAVGEPPYLSLEGLVADLQSMYGLEVQVLPPISLAGNERYPGDLIDRERDQLRAEGVAELIMRSHPLTADDRDVVLIGVMPHDMIGEGNFNYTFALGPEGERSAIVSTARLDPLAYGLPADDELLATRLRKLVVGHVGIVHWALPFSDDPTSVMRSSIVTVGDVDEIRETLSLGVEDGKHWAGEGPDRLEMFEVGKGTWAVCPHLIGLPDGEPSGLGVSLFDDSDYFLVRRDGFGVSGDLGCLPFTEEPGRFYFTLLAYEGASWSVMLRRVEPGEVLDAATLAPWERAPDALAPEPRVPGGPIVFSSDVPVVTEWFAMQELDWEACWEILPRPTGFIGPGLPYLEIRVIFESGQQEANPRFVSPSTGDGGCFEVHGRQAGNYRFAVETGATRGVWQIVVPDPTLPAAAGPRSLDVWAGSVCASWRSFELAVPEFRRYLEAMYRASYVEDDAAARAAIASDLYEEMATFLDASDTALTELGELLGPAERREVQAALEESLAGFSAATRTLLASDLSLEAFGRWEIDVHEAEAYAGEKVPLPGVTLGPLEQADCYLFSS